MKTTLAIVGMVLIGNTYAAAQQRPATPYTIDPQTHQALLTYLGDVPARFANPIISLLVQKEIEAAKALEKSEEKK